MIIQSGVDLSIKYIFGCDPEKVHICCLVKYHEVYQMEILNYTESFFILLIITILQWRFFTKHLGKNFLKSKEKRNLLIVTVLFSFVILYRAIFNGIKIHEEILDEKNEVNPID